MELVYCCVRFLIILYLPAIVELFPLLLLVPSLAKITVHTLNVLCVSFFSRCKGNTFFNSTLFLFFTDTRVVTNRFLIPHNRHLHSHNWHLLRHNGSLLWHNGSLHPHNWHLRPHNWHLHPHNWHLIQHNNSLHPHNWHLLPYNHNPFGN
jgi:hypothetical protein